MATILVLDTMYRVSVQLDDIDPQFDRWPERELVAWLNDGARALAKWLPASVSRIDTVKLAAGKSLQSIADIQAANILMGDGSTAVRTQGVQLYEAICNMGSDGLTPGSVVSVSDKGTLDALDPSWHTKTGAEVESILYDPRTPTSFYASPAPASALWLQIRYCAVPQTIALSAPGQFAMDGSDTTVIPVADAYADDLANYMLARAFLSKADLAEGAQMAQAFSQMFVASVNAQALALTGNNPNLKMLPFAPTPAGQAS
jgi:hypothetical protein